MSFCLIQIRTFVARIIGALDRVTDSPSFAAIEQGGNAACLARAVGDLPLVVGATTSRERPEERKEHDRGSDTGEPGPHSGPPLHGGSWFRPSR